MKVEIFNLKGDFESLHVIPRLESFRVVYTNARDLDKGELALIYNIMLQWKGKTAVYGKKTVAGRILSAGYFQNKIIFNTLWCIGFGKKSLCFSHLTEVTKFLTTMVKQLSPS